MSKKLVLSISGGMDSVVLLHMAIDRGFEEIHLITYNYGQRHVREIDCVQDQIDAVKAKSPNTLVTHYVADVGFIKALAPVSSLTNDDIDNPDVSKMAGDAQPVSYVPFRNQLFNTIGCAYAEAKGADTVWYGAAEVDSLAGYWDGSNEFVSAMNALVALNRENRITIEAPLLVMSKEAIVEGCFFKEFVGIIKFRIAQFTGSYRGNHDHLKLSKKRKENYYYPSKTLQD